MGQVVFKLPETLGTVPSSPKWLPVSAEALPRLRQRYAEARQSSLQCYAEARAWQAQGRPFFAEAATQGKLLADVGFRPIFRRRRVNIQSLAIQSPHHPKVTTSQCPPLSGPMRRKSFCVLAWLIHENSVFIHSHLWIMQWYQLHDPQVSTRCSAPLYFFQLPATLKPAALAISSIVIAEFSPIRRESSPTFLQPHTILPLRTIENYYESRLKPFESSKDLFSLRGFFRKSPGNELMQNTWHKRLVGKAI